MELFGTAGIRGPSSEITPELAVTVGRTTARYAGRRGRHPTVVVGRDGRTTGEGLLNGVIAGLESGGAAVRIVGRVPTPALAFASRNRYGVMLTASHNPPTDNGIKLFRDGAEFEAAAEAEIERLVSKSTSPVDWADWGEAERIDVLPNYRTAVARFANSHAPAVESVRIAVDSGTGMAALATPSVLRARGVTVDALNNNIDGHFPARASKPTPGSITTLRRFVADGPATAGIAHDGDADRIVLVDRDGDIVHEDTVVAILAEHYVESALASDPVVVTTPNASARIDQRVEAAGGRIHRIALGALHEGIAEARDEGGDVVFAAEPWKHIHPGLGGWIDGVASAAVLAGLISAEGGLEALREPVHERPYRKVSVRCSEARKAGAMDRLRRTLPDRFPDASVSEEHGIRLDRPDGSWLLVRPSGTEPYVRIYAEGESVDGIVETAREAVAAATDDG